MYSAKIKTGQLNVLTDSEGRVPDRFVFSGEYKTHQTSYIYIHPSTADKLNAYGE